MKKIDEFIQNKRSEIVSEREKTEKDLILEFISNFHDKYGIDNKFFENDDKESMINYVDLMRKEWKTHKK